MELPYESKDLVHCHPKIQTSWPIVKSKFEGYVAGYTLNLDYTYRSEAKQFSLWCQGRHQQVDGTWILNFPNPGDVRYREGVVTDKDGIHNKSHHNVYPSQALDFFVKNRQNKFVWPKGQDPTKNPLYIRIGRLWEEQGLISGAIWKYGWHDYSHVQLSYAII